MDVVGFSRLIPHGRGRMDAYPDDRSRLSPYHNVQRMVTENRGSGRIARVSREVR